MCKATACQVCGGTPYHGTYCQTCWRERDAKRKCKQPIDNYKPRELFSEGMLCPGCLVPLTSQNRYARYAMCKSCGRKKTTDKVREWRKSNQRHPANNPIVVSPKKHIARPAPKIEVKPERVPIPPGMEIKRIPLNISRWEHGGDDLWTPKEVG